MVSVSISLGALKPCFPAGLFICDVALAASSPIASDRVADRNVPPDWLKFKNPAAPAVRLETEEDWR